MKRRVIIYVNGINTIPGHPRNWNSRAVTATHLAYPGLPEAAEFPKPAPANPLFAEKVEYFCGPIARAAGQKGRAERLVELLTEYHGWEITLVGHSNGAAVVLLALELAGWPAVAAVHLVCGACEADFNRNGLNAALFGRKVQRVFVYIADRDWALRVAHTWLAHLLGYGVLGLHGALNIRPDVRQWVGELHWPGYGHSTCWLDRHFQRTMQHFLEAPSIHA